MIDRPTIEPRSGIEQGLAAHTTGNRFASRAQKLDAQSLGTQFESMFLRQAFEEMLPEDTNSIYGGGKAGGFWRSMLAENLANTFAGRNVLGVAAAIDRSMTPALEDLAK